MWEVIKLDLFGAIAWFWEKIEISRGCNASFVTIIPKVADLLALVIFGLLVLSGVTTKLLQKC